MRHTLINVVAFMGLGGFLASQQMTATTWQFWVVMLLAVVIQINSKLRA